VSEPVASLRAVVFDMDGVLTDSEPAFHAAVNDILARYGKRISLEEYSDFVGTDTPTMWTGVLARQGIDADMDAIIEEWEPLLMQRLREPRPALPHARDTIEALRARGVPVALCTASQQRWVDAILPGAGLDGMFDVISCRDMVERTKPDPAPYLLAARLLGIEPAGCLAVEDSVSGVASAAGAGMYVVQLRATSTAAAPQPGVERVISSLRKLPVDLLQPAMA
jgi:HAD superfamily hydrolase (TIGR01509 family)